MLSTNTKPQKKRKSPGDEGDQKAPSPKKNKMSKLPKGDGKPSKTTVKNGEPKPKQDGAGLKKKKVQFSTDGSKSKLSKHAKGKGKPPSKDGIPTGEKPKWAEVKKAKKELREARRKAKITAKGKATAAADVFETSHKAKLLAMQIQRKVTNPEFRKKSSKELHGMLKGHYKAIALTHDLSRVIQVLLRHGPEDIKTEIAEELIDLIVPMIHSKYAQHTVKRMLKYGTDYIRHKVLQKFYGHVVSLAAHTISAPVLDYAYKEKASNKEKIFMQQEFYGDIYNNAKDENVKKITDTYKDSPEMKAAILQACRANIGKVLDKNLHDQELLHAVLWEYMRECSPEERTELIETLAPMVVPLCNSLPGADAACYCVWYGTNKDKKKILKVVKEHAVALSTHKTGYRLLLAIFDSMDDTVLVKKAIVASLAANLRDIARNHWGNKTLHWLVKPKDTAAFHPTLIQFLAEGATSGTAKKDAAVRVEELQKEILPPLLKDVEEDPQFWLSSKATMLLVVALVSIQSSEPVLESLAKVMCDPEWTVTDNGEKRTAVEDAGIHMCLKKLAVLDKAAEGATLGEAVSKHLTEDTLNVWLPLNRGCFFLLKLIESNKKPVALKLVKKIKAHKDTLKQQTTPGAKLLLQHVLND